MDSHFASVHGLPNKYNKVKEKFKKEKEKKRTT